MAVEATQTPSDKFFSTHPNPNSNIPVPLATTIKWGDKVYLLHQQSVSTPETEVFTRKARRSPPTTMELFQNGFALGLPNGKIEIWDINGSRVLTHRSLNAKEASVNSIDTLKTNILCGTEQLTLFDSRQEDEVWSLWNKHDSPIQTVAFVSEYIFSSGSTDMFRLWDHRTTIKPLGSINLNVTSHHWCGPFMISSGTDHIVRLWGLTENSLQVTERRKLNCSAVYLTPKCEVAITPNTLYIRTTKGKISSYNTSHEAPPSAISPDKKNLVTQSSSGHLTFFPLA